MNPKTDRISVPVLKSARVQYMNEMFDHISFLIHKRTCNNLRFVKYYWIQYCEDKYRSFVVETNNRNVPIKKIEIIPDNECKTFQLVASGEKFYHVINIGFDRLDVVEYYITRRWINAVRWDPDIWSGFEDFANKTYDLFVEWFV